MNDSVLKTIFKTSKQEIYLYADDSNQIHDAKTESEMENTAYLELSIVKGVFNKLNWV